jgi:hypothetical protein
MQELKDTTYVNDGSANTIVLTTNIEKGTYKLDRDACVAGLAYLLKPLQDTIDELYVFNEQSRI